MWWWWWWRVVASGKRFRSLCARGACCPRLELLVGIVWLGDGGMVLAFAYLLTRWWEGGVGSFRASARAGWGGVSYRSSCCAELRYE